MSFTDMKSHLATIRAREDTELAERARHEYGDQFTRVFSYTKGPMRGIVKTKNLDIARQYRALKHIRSDWDLNDD